MFSLVELVALTLELVALTFSVLLEPAFAVPFSLSVVLAVAAKRCRFCFSSFKNFRQFTKTRTVMMAPAFHRMNSLLSICNRSREVVSAVM